DALICQMKHRERVCDVISRQIFVVTGVRCRVGGIRYSPATEHEKPILAVNPVQAKPLEPANAGHLARSEWVLPSHAELSGKNAQTVFLFGELNDCARGVLKPYRPLTEHEQDLLRRKGMEHDPLIIEALNIFEGRSVG